MGDDLDDDYFDFSVGNIEPDVQDDIEDRSNGIKPKKGTSTSTSKKGNTTNHEQNNKHAKIDDTDISIKTNDNKKRKNTTNDTQIQQQSGQQSSPTKKKKKKKKRDPSTLSDAQLLIQTGRTISSATTAQQCAFFNAAYCSTLASEDGSVPSKLPESRFEDNLVETPPTADLDDSTSPSAPIPDTDPNFLTFFRSLVLSPSSGGSKVLKKHRSPSPQILIISSSAKRSCAILQLLKPLKVRIAKLFSKNMSVSEQVAMLSSPHPVAVGTPSRLLKLAEEGALKMDDTRLVIMDMKEDKKGFSVLTLRDCQRDLMTLVKEHMVKREQCKIVLY
jgi:hypothetical protein